MPTNHEIAHGHLAYSDGRARPLVEVLQSLLTAADERMRPGRFSSGQARML